MSVHRDSFVFPRISDRLAVELNHFIETFGTDFQNHYYAQIRRYYDARERQCAPPDQRQLPLPLEDTLDPPF